MLKLLQNWMPLWKLTDVGLFGFRADKAAWKRIRLVSGTTWSRYAFSCSTRGKVWTKAYLYSKPNTMINIANQNALPTKK